MAKSKSSSESLKVTFGVRRCGKHKKRSGPKEGKSKPYNRQGK